LEHAIQALVGFSKMPIVTIDEFKAARLDYLVVGGGTAGISLAARYYFRHLMA
jgi:hypothetical protein